MDPIVLTPNPTASAVCVCVPTYNEAGNVARLVASILQEFDRLEIRGRVLIVDDASPDGTGEIADGLAQRHDRVHVLHRPGKQGLGRAYQDAFSWALRSAVDLVVQIDCDFSHDPTELSKLLAAATTSDLVLGSRYVAGGRVIGWPWHRRIISRAGCWYARRLLGLPVRDATGGYKCFRREALEQLLLQGMQVAGYGFQIETTLRAVEAGLEVVEVPIRFHERRVGSSKMTFAIAREAAVMVLRLRLKRTAAASRAKVRLRRDVLREPTVVQPAAAGSAWGTPMGSEPVAFAGYDDVGGRFSRVRRWRRVSEDNAAVGRRVGGS